MSPLVPTARPARLPPLVLLLFVAFLVVSMLAPAAATTAPVSVDPRVAPTLRQLKSLPGTTSLLVVENGKEIAVWRADTPLAVGSTFKIAIMIALRKQIEAGKRSWADVVRLEPLWKVPGGPLYDWPDGAHVTIETLAGFMISKSDNTATDALIHLVGRENIEPHTGRNRPLLSTRALFFARNRTNDDLIARWRRGGEAERRAVLAEIDRRPWPKTGWVDGPFAQDIEWYFTNRELCGLIAQVSDLPLMGIETLKVDKDDWARIAYKGGSEPGIVSMTYWTQAKDGRTYCASASWNNAKKPVDNDKFMAAMGRLFKALRKKA
ncbi:MAG: serine hydrolase [Armatimonadetes bacterium]|nr:serine hydrolase [Armatimonadota bacterium]